MIDLEPLQVYQAGCKYTFRYAFPMFYPLLQE